MENMDNFLIYLQILTHWQSAYCKNGPQNFMFRLQGLAIIRPCTSGIQVILCWGSNASEFVHYVVHFSAYVSRKEIYSMWLWYNHILGQPSMYVLSIRQYKVRALLPEGREETVPARRNNSTNC